VVTREFRGITTGVPIAPSASKSTEVKRLGEFGFHGCRVVTRQCRRVTAGISRVAEGWPFNPRAIITSGRGREAGRIAFDSVDYGDDRGSDDGVVTRGFAVE
jgi:hypothetical protein